MTCCAFLSLQVDIDTVEKFEALRAQEQAYFVDMVSRCKVCFVMCWLVWNKLAAVRLPERSPCCAAAIL